MLREKFIILKVYIRKEVQTNNLSSQLKKLEKEEQNKPNVTIRKQAIKITAETSV